MVGTIITKELQLFCSLANNYAQYIKHYADIAALLTDLASPKQPWAWDTAQDAAFAKLHKILCNPPVLKLLNCEKPFVIYIDACKDATGAVMLQ